MISSEELKMKKIFLLAFAAILLFASSAYAVNTVTYVAKSHIIHLADLDSDWLWSSTITNQPEGLHVFSITFNPGAVGDEAIFRDGTDGTIFFAPYCSSMYEQKCKQLGGFPFKVFFDWDNSTISTGATIEIIITKPGN